MAIAEEWKRRITGGAVAKTVRRVGYCATISRMQATRGLRRAPTATQTLAAEDYFLFGADVGPPDDATGRATTLLGYVADFVGPRPVKCWLRFENAVCLC